MEKPEIFTSAMREFTKLLCQSSFIDITGWIFYSSLSKTIIGRYDNVALLEGGKIGLVDLEHFDDKWKSGFSGFNYFQKTADAVCLFPLHLEAIICEVEKIKSDFKKERQRLEKLRDKYLKGFQLIYTDHVDFLKKKGISFEEPRKFIQASFSNEKLANEIFSEIQRQNKDPFEPFWDYLDEENLEEKQSQFATVFPKFVKLILGFANNFLEMQGGKSINSYPELTVLRTALLRK